MGAEFEAFGASCPIILLMLKPISTPHGLAGWKMGQSRVTLLPPCLVSDTSFAAMCTFSAGFFSPLLQMPDLQNRRQSSIALRGCIYVPSFCRALLLHSAGLLDSH